MQRKSFLRHLAIVLPLSLGLAACGSGGSSEAEDEMAAREDTSTEASQPEGTAADETVMANGQPAYGYGDAIDPATGYHATTELRCGFDGAAPTGSCPAGVKRKWGEDGTTLVEVTKPDGRKRAIYFRGTTPYGADSAQADGSAGWDFEVSRQGDENTVKFGPETYVVVDALVEGG